MPGMSDAEEARLIDTINDLVLKVNALAELVAPARQNIVDLLTEVQSEVNKQAGAIETLTEKVEELAKNAISSAATFRHASDEAIAALDSIEDLVDAATDAGSPLLDLDETVKAVAQDAIDTFTEEVKGWSSKLREQLEEDVVEIGKALSDEVAKPIREVIEEAFEHIQESAQDSIEQVLQPIANDLGDAVDELLDEIVDRLGAGDDETRRENQSLRPIIDALRPPVDALISQVERVQPLAATVGMG